VKSSLTKEPLSTFSFYIFCFFGYFLIGLAIAYQEVFKRYESDLLAHIAGISKIGTLNFPQMGFEYTVFIISKLSRMDFQLTAMLFFSFAIGTQAFMTYFLLHKLVRIENKKCVFFTIITMTCFAIYIPLHQIQQSLDAYLFLHRHSFIINKLITVFAAFFVHNIFGGIGSPNTWDSPTLMIVKPIGFMITYLYITQKNNKFTIFIAVLLVISCFYKPSFATIFIPSVVIYEFIGRKDMEVINSLKRVAIITLPSIFLLGIMYLIMTFVYLTPSGQHTHVIFDPLGVIHFYAKSAFGAFIQALFFPLLILMIRFKEIMIDNRFLMFSWTMLIFGYLYWALLAQTGSHFYSDGNFRWGYELGLSFVFIFSIVEYIKFARTLHDQPKKYLNLFFYIITVALALHFLSGSCFLLGLLFDVSPLKALVNFI
jgi:hypothetical protein